MRNVPPRFGSWASADRGEKPRPPSVPARNALALATETPSSETVRRKERRSMAPRRTLSASSGTARCSGEPSLLRSFVTSQVLPFLVPSSLTTAPPASSPAAARPLSAPAAPAPAPPSPPPARRPPGTPGKAADQPGAKQPHRLVAEVVRVQRQVVAITLLEPNVERLREVPPGQLVGEQHRIEDGNPFPALRVPGC